MSEKFPSRPWFEVAEHVGKSTFRLYTDEAMGTGFLLMLGKGSDTHVAVLATAWHVVKDAIGGTSLRICDRDGKEVVRSRKGNIAVMEIGNGLDSAIVVIQSPNQIFHEGALLPLLPVAVQLKTGAEIAWMGYPGIVEPEICFFQGYISGTLKNPPVYLVDGVAINGVSGGPVFDDRCHLVGLVSAYLPNRVGPETTLPGVSWVVPINFIYAWITAHLNPRDLYADPNSVYNLS
ncbi:MAG TPA: serine protease [Thermoanaerobaculia bacterium]|nr:serine protease [Thermoanaerobaculia bacterium]